MQTGLLWFDDDPNRPLEKKVARAAARYWQKYGKVPDTCYVHSAALPNGPVKVGPVTITAKQPMLPHYFWIGPQETTKEKA